MGNGGISNNHLRLGLVDHFGETHTGGAILIIIVFFIIIKNENAAEGFVEK